MIEGIDAPRPVPPELRDRLVAAIVAAEGPLAGVDAPRALPPSTRVRFVAAIVGHGAGRGRARLLVRATAVAAALVLVSGVIAVAARNGGARSSATASGPRSPAHAAGAAGPANPTTSTSTPTASQSNPPSVIVPLGSTDPVVVSLDFSRSCDELLNYLKTNGDARVTAYGLNTSSGGRVVASPASGGGTAGGPTGGTGTGGEGAASGNTNSASAAPDSAGASTTNNQEEGVAELDEVQNDGRSIFVVDNGVLEVVDSATTQLVATKSLPPGSRTMFLEGDRLLVLGDSYDGDGHQRTIVTPVDVSDPAQPVVGDTLRLDGALVSARSVDGLARVVVTGWATLPFVYPADGSPEAQAAARDHNRQVIDDSTIDQWIGGRACSSVGVPSQFSGFDLTTVYTIDPSAPDAARSASVMAGGEMVYASPSSLYVTSMNWDTWQMPVSDPSSGAAPPRPPENVTTQVHRFDISGGGAPSYVASGQVDGYTLNQYALSEYAGNLRIATTNRAPWSEGDEHSSSAVTVLAPEGGVLVPIGRVDGLGAGETIQGVRFIGPIGFVVTFHRTDPLYVVDLNDPAAPLVRGALESTGYSSYLHPIEDGFLVGVGRSADDSGRTTGEQVSVIDVRDLDAPSLFDRVDYPGAMSTVDYDPHAFLYWAPRALTVIPLLTNDGTANSAAVVLQTDHSGVREVGRVTQDRARPGYSQIYRSLVVGDTLFTVSSDGIQANSLDSLQSTGWAPFPSSNPQPSPSPEPTPAPEPQPVPPVPN